MDPRSAARCVSACPVPRVASRLGVNVGGVLHFEESGAFRRWVSTSRLVPAFRTRHLGRRSSTVSAGLLIDKKTSGSVLLPINLSLIDLLGGQTLVRYGLDAESSDSYKCLKLRLRSSGMLVLRPSLQYSMGSERGKTPLISFRQRPQKPHHHS